MLLCLSQIFKNSRYTDWILTKNANGPNLLYLDGLASLGGDLNKTSYHEDIISTTCEGTNNIALDIRSSSTCSLFLCK